MDWEAVFIRNAKVIKTITSLLSYETLNFDKYFGMICIEEKIIENVSIYVPVLEEMLKYAKNLNNNGYIQYIR